jgi:L-ribulose-5-phosphate 4-epimerase
MAEDSIGQLRNQITEGARALVSAGVLSGTLHGNWSVRIPGADRMLLTGSSLGDLKPESLAILTLAGEVIEGELSASSAEIIRMHTAVNKERPDVGSVVHTHSPFSTAFAVANRPLDCFAEILARMGCPDQIPVAAYGPRGSDQAVANIVDALHRAPDQHAILLANHGILAFGPDVATARQMVFALEETAQFMVGVAHDRRVAFEAAGTVTPSR